MKRYAIPLVKTFGSAALSNVRMILSSASHTRMLLSFAILVMMVLVPSSVKGATTTMNFTDATSSFQYYADRTSFLMSDENYSGISGAKKGNVIYYRGGSGSLDISRLAFSHNSDANAYTTDGAGFYLYAERISGTWYRGLFTGQHATRLAVLNLKPGDKVTFTYIGSSVSGNDANLHNDTNNYWFTQISTGQTATATVDVNFVGDLIVSVNRGTIINSIEIESEVAEYEITTTGNTSTFEFTKDGTMDNNDFTLPSLSASFGSIYDFLVVQNYESHMIKSDGTENLTTDPTHNYQPSAGSFYEFKPTAGGTITIEGSLQGSVMHLFVYDPNAGANGTGDWVGRDGNIFYDTFTGGTYQFTVNKGLIYYICQNNLNESGNAFHLKKFTFTTTYHIQDLGVIIENVDNYSSEGHPIQLTKTEGLGGYELKVKRCSANINPASLTAVIDQYGWLYMSKPTFVDGTDHAGTVIWDLHADNGDDAIVVTFPYHADYNPEGYTDTNRTYGHTWNFIDPRNSDSNIGNCLIRSGIASFNPGTTTGILSIGRDKDTGSQFHQEVLNREWTYSQRQTGSSGGFHDPYYANVWDMEGDNADMIWETEGLWFDTGTNLSCIYNESDAYDQNLTNPLNFATLGTDPDRYVGLLPVTDDKKSSFTIPGLKDGDRVLIFMKSGEGSGANGIFLNITGAKDALGTPINSNDLYKAGGTNWQHNRYEGCYHFIKDGDGNMTFEMKAGTMCKLLYIHIYTGQRIVTTNIVSQTSDDAGKLLFINDKGATLGSAGSASQMSLRFRGKGQNSTSRVLTYSGSLNANSFTGDNFKISGTYNHLLDFTSKVGEVGMFRLRMNDITYENNSNVNKTYVADFCDRNFTVGYRDKVDSYPYTWDFTDIQGFSSEKMSNEADNYPIAAASQDEYGYEWDISLFDTNGNMKVNTGYDPITNNLIFSPHKIGFGNQLWAGNDVIPETRGLWFHSEDDSESGYTSEYSSSLYNDCLQITNEGIRFANVPDDAGKRVAWWNYKMVVPDVPANAAVYLRMKRETNVPDDAKTWSDLDNSYVPFVATRFQFASQSGKTELFTNTPVENESGYSFYQVPDTENEWILAVKNTTGSTNHLTFTLNGWIVKKVSVSTDPKSVNIKGYASESRNHAIDASLLPFFTGKEMKSYLVSNPDYAGHTITLTDVSESPTYVIPANTGYVIFDETDKNVLDVFDEESGFHLFVPDMHDDEESEGKFASVTTNNEFMVPVLEQRTGENKLMSFSADGKKTNYVLSYKWYDLKPDGSIKGTQHVGDEMFYRVSREGINLRANSAYLVLDTDKVGLNTSQGSIQGATNPAKFTFVFSDWNDTPSVPTAIEEANSVETFDPSNGEWYNMNGQKLNGIPATKGLYIVNGKKVLVK